MKRCILFIAFLFAASALAQDWSEQVGFSYRVIPNVTYRTASGRDLKLDLVLPRRGAAPNPVVMYIHGGGWVAGTKEGAVLQLLPYIALGMSVVNVEYRMAPTDPAPAAVEDCRCALRWIVQNAAKYQFDVNRIVVAGGSAGGHLALMTGMLPVSAGLDRPCPADESIRWTGADRSEPKVAAIINWFGITDVRDLLSDAPNARGYAIEWLGSRPDAAELATRLSPMTWIRAGIPPILTIHGDADKLVPVSHATRLHDALQKAGLANQVVIIPGAGHGDFNPEQVRISYDAVRSFLRKYVLNVAPPPPAAH